ncbi:LacI family DNA-binding transcriptional regulator [Arthrobacter sedimenti]|uniref:LacI family DNA-binding transcriptional regulator n=1 Tax=Arthrobacter sedimenti TaxID=2694931 RepID=UPI000B35F980|nr:LacI family DNA-binding transcriptional regulator [Arthrobacter sedimenti]OUM43474.1 LacI family transcriptional regulator [Arthrobacter agilis]
MITGRAAKSQPTISEVALAAGVGRATAARTLGNYGSVSSDARAKVLAAAEALGYRTNALARSISTGVSKTVGVIVGDIGNPYFSGVLRGITDTIKARGYDSIILSTDENLHNEIDATSVLSDKQVDGVILASAAIGAADIRHIDSLIRRRTPVVLLDRVVPGLDVDSIVINNRAIAKKAVQNLLALGHRRIGYIWGPTRSPSDNSREGLDESIARTLWSDRERIKGYLEALDENGVGVDPLLISSTEKTETMAAHAFELLMALPEPPTAILAAESPAMIGVLHGIRRTGLTYPAGISLIGFDDTSWSEVLEPPLTMVRQPLLALGNTAAERLMLRIGGFDGPGQIHTLPAEIISRGSITHCPEATPTERSEVKPRFEQQSQ